MGGPRFRIGGVRAGRSHWSMYHRFDVPEIATGVTALSPDTRSKSSCIRNAAIRPTGSTPDRHEKPACYASMY